MQEHDAIRLLLVDDMPAVRQGLRMRCALEPDFVVIGEACDGEQALRLARLERPDVVVMDVEMSGMDGITATEALRGVAPRSAVVAVSMHEDGATRERAIAAGAAAFVSKRVPAEELIAAIRRVAGREPRP